MSVTEAARLVGVSRPALSNLLNGRAALSSEMATRLERAFNSPRHELMEMQAQYDAAQAEQKATPSGAKTYVPPFLAIKANDIESWASHNIAARARLAVLLRTLVHSTSSNLTSVDFPGNDDAQRPGWDGFIEAKEGTPWVPSGRSGWEFGTDQTPKTKADGDFSKNVRAVEEEERVQTTFVFVTPRRWPGKTAWETAQKAKALWKDVRAYDASDLEQWFEQSLPGQAWFANETRIPAQHIRTLDKCWADWADVSTPPLVGDLFSPAIEATKRTLLSRLSKPPERPIIVAADSTGEALAYLAQILGEAGGQDLAQYRDRVLVFDQPGVLPRLAAGAQTFIPVAVTRDVERELAPLARSMHSISVYPRNAATAEADIILEPVNHETFNRSLEQMGRDRDETERLAKASGSSLTVLRRQLSMVPAVRTPEWAADHSTAAKLIPFLFVGAWNSENEADKLGLSLLGDRSYGDLERECQSLVQLNDAPLWSVGSYRGVISKIDLLYAISSSVTRDDLSRYFSIARMVLGEDDPALDLAEDQRWAASIHGKTREFSSTFRKGISETLVLLAVHGEQLFKGRLGFDPELEATLVVRELLPFPLTVRVLEANDRDLPTYAEAAPDEFLSIIERDLKRDDPAVLGLLRPVDSGMLGHPSRTGLLWALEGLSWSPVTLPRAAFILARLAEVEISDNWVNKPAHSLDSIFRAWMPQTAADHQQRLDLMKRLAKTNPNVAWKLCVAQFHTRHQVGDYSHKPRWRSDGYGYGEPFPTWEPILSFVREMVEMALSWENHSLKTLSDLVERIHDLEDEDQARVWTSVKTWADTQATDADKAAMREKIRVSTFSGRVVRRKRKNANAARVSAAGKEAYAALEPGDILHQHAWLFREGWVEESAEEIEDIEKLDFKQRDERIKNLRADALRHVLSERGLEGLLELSCLGKASWVIGVLSATVVLSDEQLQQLIRLALTSLPTNQEEAHPYRNLVGGALRGLENAGRETLLKGLSTGMSDEEMGQLLVLAPFNRSTWARVDELSPEGQAKYWDEVIPDWIHDSDVESSEGVERLLKAERPRAAFASIRLKPDKLNSELLFRLLSAMAQGGKDRPNEYMLEHHSVQEAFKCLNTNSATPLEQKAGLELAYIEVLARPWDRDAKTGIPNLERYIEKHPEFFVRAIVWVYKRKHGGADPSEFQVPSDRVEAMGERGYKLLEALQRVPGHNDLGELETERLLKWTVTVREACAELDRGEIGDVYLGKLLSHAPIGQDGVWPCEAVRDVIEEIQSEPMARGAHTGVYNARGVHWRGEGGRQERDLAEKYRKWAHALQVTHPFVASKLLMSLVSTYEREASREDTEAGIRRRLH